MTLPESQRQNVLQKKKNFWRLLYFYYMEIVLKNKSKFWKVFNQNNLKLFRINESNNR